MARVPDTQAQSSSSSSTVSLSEATEHVALHDSSSGACTAQSASADGETVLATAEKNGHADVADYLRELGGHP